MQLASGSHIPDGLPAAGLLLSEKPRHGVESRNPAPHPGIDERNSTLAIGFRASLALNGVRQSERARYYAENDARFLMPDPSGLYYANPLDPQSLNLYDYVENNPLVNIDPSGLDCVYTSDLTSTSVNVTTVRGNCLKGVKGGTYVDGTINAGSYKAQVGADGHVHLSFGYTPAGGSDTGGTLAVGAGLKDLGPAVPSSSGAGGIFSMSQGDRIRALAQGVAHDTRSMPWLCNAKASLGAQLPRTPFSFGLSVDRHGFAPYAGVGATRPFGGASLTTNGRTVGSKFTAPISPVLNATISTGTNQFTVGLSRRFQFGGQMSAGGYLTFGYLGDPTCR